jgi:hypothetical protein
VKYIFNDLLAEHWYDIVTMLDENYPTENSSIFLGTYFFEGVDSYRKQLGKNVKLIIYQTEPLVDNHWHPLDKIINNLKSADEIWEYDINNYHYLRRMGFTNVSFKPFLFTKALENIPEKEPEIDILFYGTMTPHRYEVLKKIELFNRRRKFVSLWFITGKELREYISKSKIVLDLNTWSNGYQKQSRISYLLNNKKCVLSEKSLNNFYGNAIFEFNNDLHSFGTLFEYLLQDDNWKKQGQLGYEIFKNMNKETFKDIYHEQV